MDNDGALSYEDDDADDERVQWRIRHDWRGNSEDIGHWHAFQVEHASTKKREKGSLNNSYPKCLTVYPGVAPDELKCLRQYWVVSYCSAKIKIVTKVRLVEISHYVAATVIPLMIFKLYNFISKILEIAERLLQNLSESGFDTLRAHNARLSRIIVPRFGLPRSLLRCEC
jgi:hypothetical protein